MHAALLDDANWRPALPRIADVLLLVGKLNYAWTNTESLLIYLTAYLLKTNKEAAIIVFLTLNTTRARIDLLERLAKIESTSAPDRTEILDMLNRLKHEGKLRNKYNHCIYSFDETGEIGSTQLMRIAEFGDDVRYGKVEELDDQEMGRIQTTIDAIIAVNRTIWGFLNAKGIRP